MFKYMFFGGQDLNFYIKIIFSLQKSTSSLPEGSWRLILVINKSNFWGTDFYFYIKNNIWPSTGHLELTWMQREADHGSNKPTYVPTCLNI